MIIAKTAYRVNDHTRREDNERIRRDADARIAALRAAGPAARQRRLDELDEEWDIERLLEANASSLMLVGLALGRFVNRRFYAFPAVVAGFLLQHALQGWCPPVSVFRRLGVRTAREIDDERLALLT